MLPAGLMDKDFPARNVRLLLRPVAALDIILSPNSRQQLATNLPIVCLALSRWLLNGHLEMAGQVSAGRNESVMNRKVIFLMPPPRPLSDPSVFYVLINCELNIYGGGVEGVA